ncbi:MAG: S-methyl-5-thioribose-1-phosphate isomerase [Gammaproteobacteria bacterium]|nr:S-methyl-5-thioribose-1-phosphate isomerase [Gammaproteobacteria bacterium]
MKKFFEQSPAIRWKDDRLELLDQRILPARHEFLPLDDVESVADAIKDMVVRGAPAIGITAAYGVVLAARKRYAESPENWTQLINNDLECLAASRPTAVNLFWAIENMRKAIDGYQGGDPVPALLELAMKIHEDDIQANRTMGEYGADLIAQHCRDRGIERCSVLTHCNAGALATGGYGTALGVIRSAYARGIIDHVYADETRPWLQGARLTAWELLQDDIPVTLLADGACAHLMKQQKIDWVIVGSDRIAGNGDVANKIGTYTTAVAAHHHDVQFMVVAPTSTIDMSLMDGDDIPIESRQSDEILYVSGYRVAADGAEAWNPVFDVTPAKLVSAIVTENGVVQAPDAEKMANLMC